MDITPVIPAGKKIITSYGSGIFKINAETFTGNIIVLPDSISSWVNLEGANISSTGLSLFFESNTNIEILIIGCGNEHQPLNKDISNVFRQKGISVEIMTTGAACRTYNVLLSEGRKVAAALVAV